MTDAKNFGVLEVSVLKLPVLGTLAANESYIVQINMPSTLVKKESHTSLRTEASKTLMWNFKKEVPLKAKLERNTAITVSVLRYRPILSDEPVAKGDMNIWGLWKGGDLQAPVSLKALPKQQGDAANAPTAEACQVEVRIGWKDGNVPDIVKAEKENMIADGEDSAAQPGEYEGASHLHSAKSLPKCEGQDYRVHVRLHKARNLQSVKSDKRYDPMVRVTIGDESQSTDYVKRTNNPVFDEELVFPFSKVSSEFWNTPITLTVMDYYIGGIKTAIGSAQLDCGTVYRENDEHFAMNKWYVLHEEITTGNVKGFLKASIAVLNQRSDSIPEQEESDEDEDEDRIVANLVSGPGARFEEIHLGCNVYRGMDIPKMDFDLGFGNFTGTCDPYVKIAFGTKKDKTPYVNNTLTPEWNRGLDVPILLPALTSSVKLSLWDHDLTTDEVIACHRFPIDDLIANDPVDRLPRFDTKWLNLYGHPRAVDGSGFFNSYFHRMAEGEVEGCAYRGRILLGMRGVRSGVPERAPLAPPCTMVKFTTRVQLISIAMVPPGKYRARATVGLVKVKSQIRESQSLQGSSDLHFLQFDDELSVTVELPVVIPTEGAQVTVPEQLPDMIVSLYPVNPFGYDENAPFAYARFPISDVWNVASEHLRCVTMRVITDPNKISHGAEPTQPLAQLAVSAFSVASDPPIPQVPAHATIGMPAISSRAKDRFYVETCVFHAKQLPAGDDNGLSDPYVRVYWSNGVAQTGYKLETLSPNFNELLRVYGEHRRDMDFPDLTVEVWDHDIIGKDTFLGRRIVSIDDATKDDLPGKPRWYTDFYDSRGKLVSGCHVLMSVELIVITEKTKNVQPKLRKFHRKLTEHSDTYQGFEIPPDKALPTELYKVDVDVIALRHMKPFRLFNIRRPSITIEVGEHRVVLEPIAGSNPNFDQNFCIISRLPKDKDFLPEISFRVYEHRFGSKSLVGCAYVLLSDDRCDALRQTDREARLDNELKLRMKRILDIKRGAHVPDEAAGAVRPRPSFKRVAQTIRAIGGVHLIADSAADEVPAPPSRIPGVDSPSTNDLRTPLMQGQDVPTAQSSMLLEAEEAELASLDQDEYQDLWFDRFMPEVGSNVVEPDNLVTRLGKLRDCYLPQSKTTAEDYFGPFDDYMRVEIRRGWGKNSNFAGDIIVLATRTNIGEGAGTVSDGTVRSKDILRRKAVKVLCRTYVLSCSKLLAMDRGPIVGDKSDPYVVISLLSLSKDTKVIERRFIDQVKKQNLDPEFFLTCDLQGVLPKQNTLRVAIWDWDKIGRDEEIGHTDIDLEDRFFSRRGYMGGAQKTTLVPGTYTEKRTLFTESGRTAGTVEMWVDIFNLEKDEIPRPIDVQPPPPVELELRATIWNTRDVQLVDKNFAGEFMTDIYVRAWMVGFEHDVQQTDVHYRSLDGSGKFNWRMVFPVMFDPRSLKVWSPKSDSIFDVFTVDRDPKKFKPILTVQIYDNDLLPGTDDFIGETLLNLTHLIPTNSHREDQKIGPMETCCPCEFFPFNRCCLYRKDPRSLPLKEKQQLGKDEMDYEIKQREMRCEMLAEEKMMPLYERRMRDPTAFSDRYMKKAKKKFMKDAARDMRVNIFTSFMPQRQHRKHDKDLDCSPLDVAAPKVSETPKYWFACRAPDGNYRSGDVQISFQLVLKDALEKDEKLAAGKGRSDPNKMPEPHRPKDSFFWLSSPAKSAYYILWRNYKWYIITIILLIFLTIYLLLFLKGGVDVKANQVFGDETEKFELVTRAP